MVAHVRDASEGTRERLMRQSGALARMARIETLSFDPAPEGGAVQIVVDEATYVLPLAGVIDLAAEKARLTKAMDAAAKERDALSKRLDNHALVERAPPEAVVQAREELAEQDRKSVV